MLVLDSASTFTSSTFTNAIEALGTKTHFTTPGIPQTHGLVERRIGQARRILRRIMSESRTAPADWPDVLWRVALAINHTPTPTLADHAPVEVAFGMTPHTPVRSLATPLSALVQAALPDSFDDVIQETTLRRDRIRQEALDTRDLRRARDHGRHAAKAGGEVPPVIAPGTYLLACTMTRSKHRPVWNQLVQAVRHESPWLVTVRDVFPPHEETVRHLQTLRTFETSAWSLPAEVKDTLAYHLQPEYEIRRLVDLRVHPDNPTSYQVLVDWEGLSPDEATWEPVAIIAQDARATMRAFVRRYQRENPGSDLVSRVLQAHPPLRE
jgi:hypothetical protein